MLPRSISSKQLYLLAIGHFGVFVACYWLAFRLRFDFSVPADQEEVFRRTLPWILGLKLVIFYLSGGFHGSLRFVTFSDLFALVRASVVSLLVVVALNHWLVACVGGTFLIPRYVPLIDHAISILLLGGLRCAPRLAREHFWPLIDTALSKQDGCRRALIVGSDGSGEGLARQIRTTPGLHYRTVGFLDPDPGKKGLQVGGVPVLGRPDEAAEIAEAMGVEDVLIISGSLPGRELRELMECCDQADLTLKVLPAVDHLLNGHHHRNGHRRLPVRDVDINDLLRRDPVELNSGSLRTMLEGRTILVTGAGGSIGSELCRQIMKFKPKALVTVERAENNLFTIDRELQALRTSVRLWPCIADVTDRRRMRQIFRRYQPAVVFHAAAHKHVPMMEANPGEAIKNNVFGTKQLADFADQYGAECFVLISTDKAVNPSSIMGVSKQLAEQYVHALSQASSTRFVVVRFGNVLGSTGSVVPIFQEQISRGGPITITHPQMERFFMTIPEASQLVLQAAAMGKGGEIFVLDMGEPVRIVHLAQDLIRLSGFALQDIEVIFTGLRPGEKLREQLYLEDEQTGPTPHPKVRVSYHRPCSLSEVRESIIELQKVVHEAEPVIRRRLKELVPAFGSPTAARAPVPN